MVQNPSLLLLDETSEGLSPVMVAELGRLQAQGATMVIADQNLRFAAKVAAQRLRRGALAPACHDQLRLMA